jgi:hypothetical protein
MRLVPIPLDDAAIHNSAPHWLPFLPRIAQRSHESVADLIGQIARREVRLVLVMDGDKAQALVGVRIHEMSGKSYGDMIWAAGFGREQWQQLLSELEQFLRDAGCIMCRPICRPGWSRYLKQQGYRMKHVIMEKPL